MAKEPNQQPFWPYFISVEGLGPINKAEIELRPCTLVIGPNCSGKSYLVMVLYSIFKSVLPEHAEIPLFGKIDAKGKFKVGRTSRFRSNLIEMLLGQFPQFETIPRKTLDFEVREAMTGFMKQFYVNLEDSFSEPLEELINEEHDSIEISIRNRSIETKLGFDGKGAAYRKMKFTTTFDRDKIRQYYTLSEAANIEQMTKLAEAVELITSKRRNQSGFILEICKFALQTWFMSLICPAYVKRALYLPAGRGAALQTHKTIIQSMFRRIPKTLARRDSFEIPSLSGAMADFYASITDIPKSPGSFDDLASQLESNALHGEIRLKQSEFIPEFEFYQRNRRIGWQRVASGVSELAPLIIYTRYFLAPSDILIIEEPEAHLHPGLQLHLATFIASLVRRDVKVLITTHSQFMVSSLNNMMKASMISGEQRIELGSTENAYLRSNELSATLFQLDKESLISNASPIEVTKEIGIPETEFIRIHKALYDFSTMIHYRTEGDVSGGDSIEP